MEHESMTREQLYEAVWATPLGKLAKQLGVPGISLKRACTRHQIPRPETGYWTQKHFGTAWPRPSLPPLSDLALAVVSLVQDPDEPELVEELRYAIDDELNRLILAEIARPQIPVPASLRNPHVLVSAAAADDAQQAAEEKQTKPGRGWMDVVIAERAVTARANIGASRALQPRAYRVMDALLRAAEARWYEVWGKPEKYCRTTFIKMVGHTFDVRLYEPRIQRAHVLTDDERARMAKYGCIDTPNHDYPPSGELCLQLRSEGRSDPQWQVRDGPKVRVEDRLNKLFIAALRQADVERKWKRHREKEAAVEREDEQRKLQDEEVTKREQARVQVLFDLVGRWQRSREIRGYLAELRRTFAERGEVIAPDSGLAAKIRWAEGIADSFDPLRRPESPDVRHSPAAGLRPPSTSGDPVRATTIPAPTRVGLVPLSPENEDFLTVSNAC